MKTIIVRTSGERTLRECCRRLPTEPTIIELSPFERALKATYKVKIGSGADWVLVVDADLLVNPGVLRYAMEAADQARDKVFQMQGLIRDRVTGLIRFGGPRIYRAACLEEALKHIPSPEEKVRRPEAWVCKKMAEAGWLNVELPFLIADHGKEQWYRDVYRTAYVMRIKFRRELPVGPALDPVERRIVKRAYKDAASQSFPGLDAKFLRKLGERALESMGIEERDPLP